MLFGEFARSIVNANAGLFFRVVWITRLGEGVGSHDTIGESGECSIGGEWRITRVGRVADHTRLGRVFDHTSGESGMDHAIRESVGTHDGGEWWVYTTGDWGE
jgi:hypothetical protein